MSDHPISVPPKAHGGDPGLKITIQGAVVNLVLAVGKFAAGLWGSSSALTVDAVHSLSDLVTDAIAYAGRRWALRPEDRNHPYGHGRIETIASLLMGLMLVAVAIVFAVNSIRIFMRGRGPIPSSITAVAAAASIAAKEILFRATRSVGVRTASPLLLANAWHHRSDALSSVAALAGIVATRLGVPGMDPLAAVLVALMVGHAGVSIFRGAFTELADTMVDRDIRERIDSTLRDSPGVRGIHDLRARHVGRDIWVDVHLQVAPGISVSEGHQIAEQARQQVLRTVDHVRDVLVHVDPDGSRDSDPLMVDREVVMRRMEEAISGLFPVDEVEKVTIHYSNRGIHLTLRIPQDPALTLKEAGKRANSIRERLLAMENVADVRVDLTPGKPS